MKRVVCALALMLALAAACLAQSDSVRVFVWDNDAGEAAQRNPATCMDTLDRCYQVWGDYRLLTWDIYGQRYDVGTVTYDSCNFRVNSTRGDGRIRRYPDVACDTAGWFVAAWEEYSSTLGYTIAYRRFDPNGQPLGLQAVASQSAASVVKGFPKIARDKHSGYFVIAWQEQRGAVYNVYVRAYNRNGAAISDTIKVNDATAIAWHPDIAMNDTLVVVTWADKRNGDYDIYARNYYITTGSISPRGAAYQVNGDVTVRLQDYPSVAMPCSTASTGTNRYWLVAWQDSRTFSSDALSEIWCRQYSPDGTTYGFERQVSGNDRPARAPSAAKGRNRFAFAIAWEDSGTYGWQTKMRYNDQRNVWDDEHTVNASTELPGKHLSAASMYWDYASIAFLDSSRTKCQGDIFEQAYIRMPGTTADSVEPYYSNFRMNRDDKVRDNGRKGYYHFPNYDNPATTTWNENPRLGSAPDSLYLPLDSAYVQALLSRNITPATSFFRVVDTDTFSAGRAQKGSINGKTYDACVMDLGYSTGVLSAGTIDRDQQDSLLKFSGPLLCAGNDFGEMYNATTLFTKFGAVYDGPGNSAGTGNLNTVIGPTGKFTAGMQLIYPYQQAEDNSVDIIHSVSGADTIFYTNAAKWVRCSGISYGNYYKGPKASTHKNVYLPFSMAVLSSDGQYPNTTTELTRRILAYQGFNVEPAPITTLAADTGNSLPEGSVIINWNAIGDQSTSDSCKKYLLKFRGYDPARIDSGRFTSETAFLDSGETFSQTWAPKNNYASECDTLYGLPPADTLIFAIKGGDSSTVTRWGALGNEPLVKVRGDTLTPHSIGIGYRYGAVKDFIRQEQLGVNYNDTLFFTWDKSNAYVGYGGCDWRTGGDLFVYIDTRAAFGADSTTKWNAAGDTSSLFDVRGDFKPDYCLILDSLAAKCRLRRWTGAAWVDTFGTYPDTLYSLDSLHRYSYSEIKIPFKWIGYGDTTKPFKFQVLATGETSEHTFNAFPPFNNIGKAKAPPARYGYYYSINGLTSGKKPGDTTVTKPLAIELSQFTATTGAGTAELRWRTESETGAYAWLIERSQQPDAGYTRIAIVPAAGSASQGHSYTYHDNTVAAGASYYYLLGDQDLSGEVTWHGPLQLIMPGDAVVTTLSLEACRPNPAHGSVSFSYALPRPGTALVKVYDLCGREVKTLVNGQRPAGRDHATWDGTDLTGRHAVSGVYFYRLSFEGANITRRFVLLQ